MSAASGDADSRGTRPAWLAEPYDSAAQQLEAGRMGMWLFLATEILLFGGLFAGYVIVRNLHPEAFAYGQRYLSVFLGTLNTIILASSGLTMAWGVRAAAQGQPRLCAWMLSFTLLLGLAFVAVKGVEYVDKFHHGTLPGLHFQPSAPPGHEGEPPPPEVPATPEPPPGEAPGGEEPGADAPAGAAPVAPGSQRPVGVWQFFGIYFTMTGLHLLHLLVGLGLLAWVLRRNARGDFSREYSTPVEMVGLYWHLVDVIWIYLFPLLYLV